MDNYISAHNIYNGILLGAKRISFYREELNIANKFPVPDSDTGDNLHYQMTRIRSNLKYNSNINTILSSASELALINSRGNSGAIFSQFFVGFEKSTPNESMIDISAFIKCFKNGYKFALNSINNPITEGTILIAIRTWSEALENNFKKYTSIDKLYQICFDELKKAVDASKYVLKEQSKSRYSDAGASAFLYFIEGFMSAIVYNEEDLVDEEDIGEIKSIDFHSEDGVELSRYRFCTEVLLKKNEKTFDKKLVFDLGDSLVLSESKNYLKIHFHTDKPYDLVKLLSKYGEIIESKCDDMKIQSISGNIGGTAIIIDSIADIPEFFYTKNTYMIPVNILSDNVSFKDKRTTYPELLHAPKLSSSQTSIEEMRFVISKLLASYDDVLILTVSSKMSGIYNQYKKVVDEVNNERLHLIDTKLNSVAEGLVVSKVIEMLNRDVPIDEMLSNLRTYIDKTKILVSLKTIDRVVASGRLNSKLGSLLKWIHFRPIIGIDDDGKGMIYRFSFSENKNKDIILKDLLAKSEKIENYAIVHSDCLDEAREYARNLEGALGYPPLYISEASYVIQSFSGKGSIAVGYTLKE